MMKIIFSKIVKYYATLIYVVFAVDLGYVKYKSSKNRNIIRFWLLLQSLALIAYCLFNFYSAENYRVIFVFFWILGYCAHLYFLVIILQFTKNDISFRKLSADLENALGSHDDNLEVKMAATIGLSFVLRISDLFYCVLRNPLTISLIILSGISLCMDMVLLNCTFLFYAPLCRLKNSADTMKTGNVDLRTGQHIYKSIADVTEKYKDAISLLYITSFFCTTLESLAVMSEGVFVLLEVLPIITNTFLKKPGDDTLPNSYSMLITTNVFVILGRACSSRSSVDKLHNARLWIYLTVNLLMSFAPALTAGLMTSQASKIKLILIEKLMEEIDPMKEQAIDRFLGYIDARPLRLRMWRVFPLDTDLIGAMLHFIVQHMIVIVQCRVAAHPAEVAESHMRHGP